MSLAAKIIPKPISMATNDCLISVPSLFTPSKASHSYPDLSIPFKPIIKSQLLCSFSSSISLTSLKKKEPFLRVSVFEENNPVLLEEQQQEEESVGNLNWGGSENEFEGGESGGFVEPPEEAKVYVGNLPYDVDSEKLAKLFEEAGVVEISEVIYNRDTDQSRGFGFVTMSTVEEANKAVEMFHRYFEGRDNRLYIA